MKTLTILQLKKHEKQFYTTPAAPVSPSASQAPTLANPLSLQSYDQFKSLKTWAEVLSQLNVLGDAMLFSLDQKDQDTVSSSCDSLTSFIGYISVLAGIPPGTSPSSTTNTQVARAYRRMITSMSKLGLSNDITKDSNAQPGQGGSGNASLPISDLNSNSLQLSAKETTNLISEAKTFIAVYCQTIAVNVNDAIIPVDTSSRDKLYEVRQSRVDAWASTQPARSNTPLELENMSTVIPLDAEVVNVLDYQRNTIMGVLRQIFSLLDMKPSTIIGTNLNAQQFLRDRQQLLLSTVSSFVGLISNMSNLVESVDLSIFQPKRNSPAAESSSPSSLILLYDFFQLKQTLYDDLIASINAVQIVGDGEDHMMDLLATSLSSIELSDDSKQLLGTSEDTIKNRALEIASTVDSIIQNASALAHERDILLGRNKPSTPDSEGSIDSNNISHRHHAKLGHRESGSSLATSNLSSFKEDGPWFLNLEHRHELVFDAKHQLKGGTLDSIIERLTQHNAVHPTFNVAILLTTKSFATPQELFQMLVRRYNIQAPDGISEDEYGIWAEKKQKIIKQRVANVLKLWLTEYWFEDCSTKAIKILLASMLAFGEQIGQDNCTGHELISDTIETLLTDGPSRKQAKHTTRPPPSVLPRNMKKMKILDVDPLELARQLTIREYKILAKITPGELMSRRHRKGFTRGAAAEEAKYVDLFISNSNELTNWVGNMILSYHDAKKRSQAVKYFVNVAEYCRLCNNYSSLMAIVSALYSAAIHRMKRTWALVSTRTHDTLDHMNKLMSSNGGFQDYRLVLSKVKPPAIPFFGVYLSDLALIEDSNADSVQDNVKILSIVKRMKMAEIVKNMLLYQTESYNLTEVPAIQALLSSGFSSASPIDTLYESSLALEPRERANERMARLLEETGYL